MNTKFENLFCDNCHNLLFPTRVFEKKDSTRMILECKICFSEKEIEQSQRVFYSKSFQNAARKKYFENSVIQYDYTLKRINLLESSENLAAVPKEYVYVLDSNLKQTLYETEENFGKSASTLASAAGPSSSKEPMEL